MKRFFHIIAILLFALIIAWLYEVYYMRGGQLSWTNPVAEFVTEKWWWEPILWFRSWDNGDNNAPKKITDPAPVKQDTTKDPSIPDESEEKNDKDIKWLENQKTTWLLAEYTTWSLSPIHFNRLWLSDSGEFTYTILEYCAHSEDLCQDAYESNIANETVTLMWSDALLIRKPFIWDLSWSDALVWLGESCVDDTSLDAYHTLIYKNWVPDDEQSLQRIGEELWVDWFAECIAWWSAEIFITQQMKLWNSLFGVTKIPSYVLIDNVNKNRALIPGLYSLKEIGEVMTQEFDFTGFE